MYTLKVQNSRGEILNLTRNPNYTVISVDGLLQPNANISTTEVNTIDGSLLNYTRVTERNIVLRIMPLGNIEENRIHLYKWFTSKQKVRIYFKNGDRDAYIDGYVETFEGSLFENPQTLQVSIICPDTYFKDVSEISQDANYTTPLFEFPFSISQDGIELSTYDSTSTIIVDNKSDAEAGMTVNIRASGEVVNPTIYRRNTLERLKLNFTMQASDTIKISTHKGNKSITLIRNGTESNIMNSIDKKIVWFQLHPGENLFTYEAESGMEYLSVSFKYNFIYGGV